MTLNKTVRMVNEYSQCGASEPFALRVIGDDMAPEFCDGNIVVVDTGGVIRNDCYVIARLQQDTLLRQLQIFNGKFYLKRVSIEPLVEIAQQDIIGVVSQKAGRRRHQRKRYDI